MSTIRQTPPPRPGDPFDAAPEAPGPGPPSTFSTGPTRAPTRASPPASAGRRRTGPGATAVALTLVGILLAVDAQVVPRPGESLPLRWTRTAAAHPWRTALALFLLVRAARPPQAFVNL